MGMTRDGDVHILTLSDGPNLLDQVSADALHARLDEVQAACQGPGALVLTGRGKFFSNGLDLPVVMGYQGEDQKRFGRTMGRLFGRLITFPTPTVAALNGHAFAGGALLAIACDYRIMREDRGWLCMSEVDAGVPIAPPLMGLLRAKLPATTLRDAVLAGKRFSAAEAVAAGYADGHAPEADLLAHAVKHAAELATKERGIFATLKKTLWGDVARGLGYDPDETAGGK